MVLTVPTAVSAGILLPASVLQSEFFAVLSAFVAINTIIYVTLAVSKIVPKVHVGFLWYSVRGKNRRRESRSIYPDGWPNGNPGHREHA